MLLALRSHMARAGWHRINPWVEDGFEAAEAAYRSAQDAEPPVHGCAKFRIRDRWYLYEQARPHVREALELHLKPSKRSAEARWLAAALHDESDAVHEETLRAIAPKLLAIHAGLRPL